MDTQEDRRLSALRALSVLDSAPEPAFDALVELAARICGTPISLMSLVDEQRQWFKANVGLPGTTETPRDVAFCAYAILQSEVMEVCDAKADARFSDNPLVTGQPNIRYYAGAPISLSDGARVGTLCVIDRETRKLTDAQLEMLQLLARAAAAALEGRRALIHEAQYNKTNAGYSALVQSSVDPILSLDRSGHIASWNGAAERLLGYTSAEVLGQSITLLARPERQVEKMALVDRIVHAAQPAFYETSLRKKDGGELPSSTSFSPIIDDTGQVTGVSLVVRDLTALRQSESIRRLTEEKFRLLSEASPLGVFHADTAGRLIYTNRNWRDILGLDAAVAPDAWLSNVHPADQYALRHQWGLSLSHAVPLDMTVRVGAGSTSSRFVRLRSRSLTSESGQIAGIVGTAEDVSEATQHVADLMTREHILRRLYESTPAMLHSIDPQGRIIFVSDTWLSRMGYRRDEVVGRRSSDFMTPESQRYAKDVVLPAFFATGSCDKTEYQMVTKSGVIIDVLLSAKLDHDVVTGNTRTIAVIEDVTLRRQAERALIEGRERLTHIVDGIHAGTWEWNLDRDDIQFNERWARMIGATEAASIHGPYQRFVELIHPEDRLGLQEMIDAHLDDRRDNVEIDVRVRHADGRWIWIQINGRVSVRGDNGTAHWMHGICLNVTARKEQDEALRDATSRMSVAADSGQIGIWDLDLQSGRLTWDQRMHRIYGTAELMVEPDYALWLRYLHPLDKERAERDAQDAIDQGSFLDTEFRIIRSDGEIRHVRATAQVIHDDQDRPIRLIGANWDITNAKMIAAELAESHELLRVTLKSIGDAVITTDGSGRVQWLNPVAERMTGWTAAEAKGCTVSRVFRIIDEHSRLPAPDPVATCIQEGAIVGLANHTLLLSRDGSEYGIEDSAAPIRNEQGDILGAVLVFHDVTEQRRLSGEMNYRASHDALTGCLNRSEFDAQLRRVLTRLSDDHNDSAVLFIDLDQFKLINDTCGHTAGDLLLQQVSKILSEAIRGSDILARLGGDEFGIILDHCPIDQARRVSQQICDRMNDFRFTHDDRRFRVGCSIGLVPVDARWENSNQLMQAADTACYAAKEAGRNRVHTWSDSDLALQVRQGEMNWAARIQQAIDEDRFVLFMQRVERIDRTGGGMSGLHGEVLLRLPNAQGDLIAPGAFLPAAERFHMATRIDRWVFLKVADRLASMPDLTGIDSIAINLSGQSIGDRSFHRYVVEILGDVAFDRSKLCFEITETAAITNLPDAILFIEEMRRLGVRIALDDFGAGASSFGYLKSLPVDILKIDGQFIRDLTSDRLDAITVRCFHDVAKTMGISTVAECVETAEVMRALAEIGIDYAQGYYLHRPEALDNLLGSATGKTRAVRRRVRL